MNILHSFDNTYFNTLPLHIVKKVDMMLTRQAYEQSKIGLVTALFCATIVLIGLHNNAGQNEFLYIWYTFFLTVTLARWINTEVYLHQAAPEKHLLVWQRLFTLGACLGGISWGLTGTYLFSHAHPAQQTLIVLILAGITAGAVPLLAGMLWAIIGFLAPALCMLILTLATMQGIYALFNLTLIAYLGYLIVVAIKTHSMIKMSIAFRFENDSLLKDLSDVVGKLEYSATHDHMTQAGNRNFFELHFAHALQKAEHTRTTVALLYMDLDSFKQVNDTYGHHVGDKLLLIVVERLHKVLRKTDIVARLGGDEFAVVLENVTAREDVANIAHTICQVMAYPVEINGLSIHVTACIGISLYPFDGQDTEALIKAADQAMYYVKSHGNNNFHFSCQENSAQELV